MRLTKTFPAPTSDSDLAPSAFAVGVPRKVPEIDCADGLHCTNPKAAIAPRPSRMLGPSGFFGSKKKVNAGKNEPCSGSYAVFGGGVGCAADDCSTIDVYDDVTDRWVQSSASLSMARQYAMGAGVGGLAVFGGRHRQLETLETR